MAFSSSRRLLPSTAAASVADPRLLLLLPSRDRRLPKDASFLERIASSRYDLFSRRSSDSVFLRRLPSRSRRHRSLLASCRMASSSTADWCRGRRARFFASDPSCSVFSTVSYVVPPQFSRWASFGCPFRHPAPMCGEVEGLWAAAITPLCSY